ncbi:hypothetical protein U1Q18_039098 [Sarracenia purpurea var. burkii]
MSFRSERGLLSFDSNQYSAIERRGPVRRLPWRRSGDSQLRNAGEGRVRRSVARGVKCRLDDRLEGRRRREIEGWLDDRPEGRRCREIDGRLDDRPEGRRCREIDGRLDDRPEGRRCLEIDGRLADRLEGRRCETCGARHKLGGRGLG